MVSTFESGHIIKVLVQCDGKCCAWVASEIDIVVVGEVEDHGLVCWNIFLSSKDMAKEFPSSSDAESSKRITRLNAPNFDR